MAICINRNGICFGSYSITPSTDGICISGAFSHQGTELIPTQAQGSVSGYHSGGTLASFANDTINKFPFTSDTNATDVGDLSECRTQNAGQSSTVSGYTSGGGFAPEPTVDTIDKFPFTSDTNATDVGDLTVARRNVAGQTSTVSGYSSGGVPTTDTIDKFPFSSDTNATDVGNLSQSRNGSSGQSSRENGYTSGGAPPIQAISIPSTSFHFLQILMRLMLEIYHRLGLVRQDNRQLKMVMHQGVTYHQIPM